MIYYNKDMARARKMKKIMSRSQELKKKGVKKHLKQAWADYAAGKIK